MTDLSFDIPNTPENRAAMKALKKEFMDAPATLYAEDEHGNVFPVANISKHPDCPPGWYEDILKRFLHLKEED